MKAERLAIPDLILIEPARFGDDRGFFSEVFSRRALAAHGLTADFVQDNHSRSARGVLRGLHYQLHQPQGKLVRVIAGEVFDVCFGPEIRLKINAIAITNRQPSTFNQRKAIHSTFQA